MDDVHLIQELETRISTVNVSDADSLVQNLIEGQRESEKQIFAEPLLDDKTSFFSFHQSERPAECLLPLAEFISNNNVEQMYIYPNYRPPLYTAPKGYVAEFKFQDAFRAEPFLLNDIFRTLGLYEIKWPAAYASMEARFGAAHILRNCFPYDSLVTPTLNEHVQEGGWGAELGLVGGMIGIMKIRRTSTEEEEDEGEKQRVEKTLTTEQGISHRYFIYVQSGLPRMMVNLLHRELENIPPGQTFQDVFVHHPNNLLQKFKELAAENSHRLAYMFARQLGLEPLCAAREYASSTLREVSVDLLKQTSSIDLLEEVLEKHWPKGVPLNKASRLAWYPSPSSSSQVKEAPVLRKALQDYPVGLLFSELPFERKQSLKEKYQIRWEDHPCALDPSVFTEINTFVVKTNRVLFFNGVSPIPTDLKQGFIRVLPPISGIYVYFSSAFPETTKETMDYAWSNTFGGGIPNQWPMQIKQTETATSAGWAQQLSIFFDRFHGLSAGTSSTLPLVLRQNFTRGIFDWCSGNLSFSSSDEHMSVRSATVKKQLFGTNNITDRRHVTLDADPFMFCSPAVWEEGICLDVFNSDIFRSVMFT